MSKNQNPKTVTSAKLLALTARLQKLEKQALKLAESVAESRALYIQYSLLLGGNTKIRQQLVDDCRTWCYTEWLNSVAGPKPQEIDRLQRWLVAEETWKPKKLKRKQHALLDARSTILATAKSYVKQLAPHVQTPHLRLASVRAFAIQALSACTTLRLKLEDA